MLRKFVAPHLLLRNYFGSQNFNTSARLALAHTQTNTDNSNATSSNSGAALERGVSRMPARSMSRHNPNPFSKQLSFNSSDTAATATEQKLEVRENSKKAVQEFFSQKVSSIFQANPGNQRIVRPTSGIGFINAEEEEEELDELQRFQNYISPMNEKGKNVRKSIIHGFLQAQR